MKHPHRMPEFVKESRVFRCSVTPIIDTHVESVDPNITGFGDGAGKNANAAAVEASNSTR